MNPPALETLRAGSAEVRVAPELRSWVEAQLGRGLTLYQAAASHPDRRELSGRGPVYVLPLAVACVVRHCFRGGRVAAPVLRDRYLAVGEPRPFREARTSAVARDRGIATPRVLAAAVYRAWPFYRGDVVTAYIAESHDLAEALFGDRAAAARPSLLRTAGALVADLARAGITHEDLNARNVLLAPGPEGLRAHALDLDRCRAEEPQVSVSAERMLGRLVRSLEKLGSDTQRPLSAEDLRVLSRAALA